MLIFAAIVTTTCVAFRRLFLLRSDPAQQPLAAEPSPTGAQIS